MDRPLVDALTPTDRPQFEAMLDACFSVPQGLHYLEDFPVWDFSGATGVLRLGVFGPNRALLACTAARVTDAWVGRPGGAKYRIALIGAVATDARARGKGYASELVTMASAWAQEQGALLALLWGSEHHLYQRLGFDLCGAQKRIPLSQLPLGGGGAEIKKGWQPAIFDLLKKRSGGLALTDTDLGWMAKHKNVQWWSAWKDGAPQAYAAINRGIDLQNFVHEWGWAEGGQGTFAQLLAEVAKTHAGAEILVPGVALPAGFPCPAALHQSLPAEFLGLARVLDPAKLIRAFHADAQVSARSLEGGWELALEGTTIPQLGEGEVAQLLLGPGASSSKWLPLPVWVWGLDAC